MSANQEKAIHWVPASRDYQVALVDGKLVCRNPQGKQLASIPSWMKEDEAADRLTALGAWLNEHRLGCVHTVERWMLRSLTVPMSILAEVWVDEDWRETLQNLVVVPATLKGECDHQKAGILRDVQVKRGAGIVDLDGETHWFNSDAFLIPHPILIRDLTELRELVSELGVSQTLEQLYRPVYAATDPQKKLKSITDYSGGMFEQLNFATGLCKRLGYPVRGGYATCKIWEGAAPLEARYYLGDSEPESQTWTGDLLFVDSQQQPVSIGEVGAVTFSEGVRMASAIYAKRKVEAESGESQ